MRPLLKLTLIALTAAAAGLTVHSAASATEPVSVSSAEMAQSPRRIMVMLQLGAEHYQPGSDYGGDYGPAMSEKARLRLARRIARGHGLKVIESWPMQRIGVDCVIMDIPDGRSADSVAAELTAVRGVAWSQPLNEFEMQGSGAAVPYNDRLYRAQPASSRWHLASLHRYATGRGVTIAIVDSRIDQSHPDLAGRIASSPDFTSNKDRSAENHGTGVAGIIAARPNNSLGIAGVAPDARVLGLRACWERPHGGSTVCDSLSLAKALTYAIDTHADVINMSFTGPRDRLIATLISLAIAHGSTVVAAVDENRPEASFPAMVDGVIPVADERLSARGAGVYIAPGLDVPTTEPEGKWSLVSGSSYAAAHVSGLAALLRQLSGNHITNAEAATIFGPRGTIDACAAIARLSRLDTAGCSARQ